MNQKHRMIGAALLSASVGLGAQAVFAQSTVPGGAVGPNDPLGPSVPRQTQPTIPGQPAPGIPQTRPLPGGPGTIPERAQPPSSDRNMAVTSDDIKKAQEALKAKGLNPGSDGRMDIKTQQALRDFQKANDLPVTGVLDQKTAEKLGVNQNNDMKSMPERGGSSSSLPNSSPAIK